MLTIAYGTVMTTGTVPDYTTVVNRRRYPGGGRVAIITCAGTCNVGRMLTSGYRTVVTI